MPEVLEAQERLARLGASAGVVCLTSADLVYEDFHARGSADAPRSGICDVLFPADSPAPLVTVLDGHPHTLSFLAGIRGDAIRCLGVRSFGQSSSVEEAYRLHGIDPDSIVRAAADLTGI